MKHLTLLFRTLVLLFAMPLHAQVTYTSANFMQIGDTMLFSEQTANLNALSFDTTGANMFWDYSTLTYQTQSTAFYFDPFSSGYASIWCLNNGYGPLSCLSNFGNLSNQAIRSSDSLVLGQLSLTNTVAHQLKSGNVVQERMIGLTAEISGIPVPFTFDYSHADSLYQFPLQYLMKDSSRSRIVYDLAPAPVVQSRNAKRINHVEGWGSLTTPYGHFPNVLKMKTTIERTDTLFLNGMAVPASGTLVEYKWWDANYGLPVLIASGSIIGQTPIISTVKYLDSTRCVEPTALFSYNPLLPVLDSVSQSVQVDFYNLSTNVDSVIWDLGDGTITQTYSPSHTYHCPGIKTIQLIAFNQGNAQLFSDTLALPLFISDSTQNTAIDTGLVSICVGDSVLIHGNYQSTAGIYIGVSTGADGCDSTSLVRLQLSTLPDTSVSQQANTLYAEADSLDYQWLDCNNAFSPIPGATNQQYTPQVSGSYALLVTNGGCSAMSSCYTLALTNSIPELGWTQLRVYPNPARDYISMEVLGSGNVEFFLYSLTGGRLKQTKQNNLYIGDLASGTYLLMALDSKGTFHPFLIQKLE